jgi:hypothetical protein
MAGVGGSDKHVEPDDPDDAARLQAVAAALADAVEAALPGWVERAVERRVPLATGDVRARAADAGRRAVEELGPRIRGLLATDVDEQRTNPLAVLRSAVRFPAEVLAEAGVPPVRRDEFAERAFPDDVYDLAPATWADVDPALHERGIVWGAAKAHVVLSRRRREGKR